MPESRQWQKPQSAGKIWVEKRQDSLYGDGTDPDAFCKGTGIPGLAADKEIDCEGNVLMPGFKGCAYPFGHGGHAFLLRDDMPLQEWLNTKIFPSGSEMTDRIIMI